MKTEKINTLISKVLSDLRHETELMQVSKTRDEKNEHMGRILMMHTMLVTLAEQRRKSISWFWLTDKLSAWKFEMEVKDFHARVLTADIE